MSPIERLSDDENFSKSSNLVNENIEALKELFPEAVGEDGIDFDILRQILGEEISLTDEKFGLNWPGKREARNAGLAATQGALIPEVEKSVDWDGTNNIFVEGDNLEVLKLMKKSYAGRAKMIYIDPPYNTGRDFVYRDDYRDNLANYLQFSEQVSEAGERLQANTAASGRKHSKWLSMMYPRLRNASGLLAPSGVIFVSIDDNESAELKILLDDIFGPENFVAQFTREVIRGGSVSRHVRVVHDYVLCYAKDISCLEFGGIPQEEINLDRSDQLGPYFRGRELNKWGAGSRRQDAPSMWFSIPGPEGVEVWPIRNDGSEGRWRYGRKGLLDMVEAGDVEFELRPSGHYVAYQKIRVSEKEDKQFTTIFSGSFTNSRGAERLKALFASSRALFDYAKPLELISSLMKMSQVSDGDLVVDFFAGSGTTGDAVMQYNAENGVKAHFLLVQLPESATANTELFAQGFESIPEATRERLRLAGNYAKAQAGLGVDELDIGFRSFKLAASNVRPWQASAEDLDSQLDLNIDNIVEGRSELDVLFELILKLGLELTSPIESFDVSGKTLHSVGEGSLYACLSTSITRQNGIELAQKVIELHEASGIEGEVNVIFRDSGFIDDSAKLNMAEMLAQAGFPALRTI